MTQSKGGSSNKGKQQPTSPSSTKGKPANNNNSNNTASQSATAPTTTKGNNNDKNNNNNNNGSSKLVRSKPYVVETDFADVFYKPHTITVAFALLVVLGLLYNLYHVQGDSVASIRLGVLASLLAFVAFGSVHLPDSLLVRPHPFVWRVVLSLAVVYMCLLVFLFFVDHGTVRAMLIAVDPKLGEKLPDQSYAEDCEFSTPENKYKFFNTVFDVFILAHSLGYFVKILILRDWRVTTALSLSFEVVEVSMQHILPNFKECWWDHLLADVLICNGGGTIMGALFLRAISARHYNWVRIRDIPTMQGKAKRVLSQFWPRQVDPYEWQMFASFKSFCQVCLIVCLLLLQEVNCFVSKNILQMHPEHPIVIGRLVLWGLFALPAVREYFEFISNPECNRVGTTLWVTGVCLALETIVNVKWMYEGQFFDTPMPPNVALPLLAALAMLVLWIICYFFIRVLRRWLLTRILMNMMFYSVLVITALMCVMSNPDVQWKQREFLDFVKKHHLWYR